MKRFAALFSALDETTSTNSKISDLAGYLQAEPEDDRLWAVAILSGRRPRRAVTSTRLRDWAAEVAAIPPWLFDDSYSTVGDLAETIALLLPPAGAQSDATLAEVIADLQRIATLPEEDRRAAVLGWWGRLDPVGRLVFNKLLTGGFRLGVGQRLMTRALAQATGMEPADLAHRLMGDWTPDTRSWRDLLGGDDPARDASRPYPFCLAHGVEGDPAALGPVGDWLAEWKWDGIRGQLIRRGVGCYLWSRGEELITDRFPELAAAAAALPDGTVLDGEILAWDVAAGAPQPFAALQRRIGRKTVPRKLLTEAPTVLLVYDLLEAGGQDLRAAPLATRRDRLAALLSELPADAALRASPAVAAQGWAGLAAHRAGARGRRAEGLMLKRLSSPYHAGRKRGDWWKWKLDPLSIDAVMVYAQAGHGRRANLFSDYTFALRDGAEWVPFAKAYSGLSDAELRQITAWVRRNTLQRFGPVRQVPPELVFEIGFEGIQPSPRHKSGVALRFPRMLRWRQDKRADQADTLDHLRAILAEHG